MAKSLRTLAEGALLVEDFGVTKLITLNREKALNALTWPMVKALQPLYDEWQRSQKGACAIVMRGAGKKAFCAGGDVVGLAKDDPPGTRVHFFKEEYTLNYTIGNLMKQSGIPHIAILDGITMGGGVGLSLHGSHRVCTEATMLAMPECALGLFPDVGGNIFLPRLSHPGLGEYFALTGRRLKGADVKHAGMGTHFVPRDSVPDLVNSLTQLSSPNSVDSVIKSFVAPTIPEFSLDDATLQLIKTCFSVPQKVEDVLNALSREMDQELSNSIMRDILKGSPTSLKVTLEQLRRGAKMTDTAENYQMEYRLSQGFMNLTDDFNEGVRATLLDKTNDPHWKPSSIAQVQESFVSKFFDTVPASGDLKLSSRSTTSRL